MFTILDEIPNEKTDEHNLELSFGVLIGRSVTI